MRTLRLLGLLAVCLSYPSVLVADSLERGFAQPPETTKPWCYWYWITDNISKEGITRDLEAMARVGIGEALIGNIYLEDVQRGSVKALTEEWWSMVEHAIREGGRVGVNLGFFNCPGWSQSGGPWVRPDQAMRYLESCERRVHGPTTFQEKLSVPAEPFQDVSLVAFPAPRADADSLPSRTRQVRCLPAAEGASLLFDGNPATTFVFPSGVAQGNTPFVVDLELTEPLTARSLVLHPARMAFSVQCELQVATGPDTFRSVRSFPCDRSNTGVNVGPMPYGPVSIAFAPETARSFRLVFTRLSGKGGFTEIALTGAARVERFVEKQLGKMHPTPQPLWDTYLWPAQAELDEPGLAVPPESVVDLRRQLRADGTLHWQVPAGDWVILRTGMTLTRTTNAPAPPEGQGLEVDKMNRAAAAAHFEAYVGKLLARMPAKERRAFTHVVADSYEMGSQNWTDGFGDLFRQRYGYDATPWLPVLTGRIVASADQSNRFLWDLRRLVADRVAMDYVGGLRELCHRHGLRLWLENYGHWGFPAEFLQYGGQTDQIGGEFWATGELGSIELRAATSASHTYGFPITSAEAFTGGPFFVSTPWSLKRRGDWATTEGINHFVLHVNIHQPDERRPGVNAWFGTEFNRHNTWFDSSRAWIDYLRRTHFLMQQGNHVADVAYFIGEDTPKMTGVCQPPLPPGYDFDYLNAEVIQQRLKVKSGRFVLPEGKSYRLVVLPDLTTMRPEVLRALRGLVAAGGVILGPPPTRSPSRQGFPACDAEVRRTASEMWQDCDGKAVQEVRYGRGRVLRGLDLTAALARLETLPDLAGTDPKQLLWTHRSMGATDVYFLSNQADRPVVVAPAFRVRGKAPELWDPATAQITRPAVFERLGQTTRVPLRLDARGSVAVVFRQPIGKAATVTNLTRDGQTLLTAAPDLGRLASPAGADAGNTFTLAGWLKPTVDIALPAETNAGVQLALARNDAVWAAHGESLFGSPTHACAGISAGRNGVVVYEHSGNYFAPILSCRTTLNDWAHLAVVYEDGQPSLWVNGRRVAVGLRSRFQVHPGSPGEIGPGGPFRGELGEFQIEGRALTSAQLAELAKSGPPRVSGAAFPAIRLERGSGGATHVMAWEAGDYVLKRSDGQTRSFTVKPRSDLIELRGPWQVRFPQGMDAPDRVMFPELISWSDHTNAAIKYFAGTAAYSCRFNVVDPRMPLTLDLGRVESLAEVILNGRPLGVLWQPPFTLDLASALRGGENELEVRVTGAWLNRLIGAKRHPDGLPGVSTREFQPYLAADVRGQLGDSLVPSGLLGPVRLLPCERLSVR